MQAIREYPLLSPSPDQEVQDPSTIVDAARQALLECVSALDGAGVTAICLSAAMHGLVGLAGDGTPTTPLITWADGRAVDEALQIARSPSADLLRASTGAPIHPMTPLAKLRWFARHEPEIWRRTRWWAGLKDYLLLWLTGTVATELSSASGTGLLDVRTGGWSPVALDLCGLHDDRLPPILSPTAVLALSARAASTLGIPQGTPVVAGAGDGPLANVGTGAIEPGIAALSLGTSGAVRTTVDGPRLDPTGALFCYAVTESLWVVGGAMSNGADVVRWAGEALVPDVAGGASRVGEGAVLELAGLIDPGSDGLVMLPFLLPERAPMWSPDIRASYLGLRRSHTRAHMTRAAVEGVCIHMAGILERVAGVQAVTSVRATGGAFRSKLWRQIMASAVEPPFHVLDGSEGTALGAAALGLHALDPGIGLADALRQLGAPSEPPPPVPRDPQVTRALTEARNRTGVLLEALSAGLYPARRP